MKKTLSLLAVATLLVAAPAFAGSGKDCDAKDFHWVQADGDHHAVHGVAGDADHEVVYKKIQRVSSESASDAWLGLALMKTVSQKGDAAPEGGEMKVAHVFEGSPAEAAGFRKGDQVISVEGKTLEDTDGFVAAVRNREPGDNLTFVINRDGRDLTVTATLGERSENVAGFGKKAIFMQAGEGGDFDVRKDIEVFEMDDLNDFTMKLGGSGKIVLKNILECDDDEDCVLETVLGCDEEAPCVMEFLGRHQGPLLGVRVESLTDQLAGYFGVDDGVLVTEVLSGMPAESAGIEAGDVLTWVGSSSIADPGDIHKALREIELPGTVRVEAVRRGRTMTFDVPMDKPEAPAHVTPGTFRLQRKVQSGGTSAKI